MHHLQSTGYDEFEETGKTPLAHFWLTFQARFEPTSPGGQKRFFVARNPNQAIPSDRTVIGEVLFLDLLAST
jgi:hypothetical protein